MNSVERTLKILLVAMSIALLSRGVVAKERQTEVELTHWWNQPGEVAALHEIQQVAEQRGARFIDTPIATWDKLRSGIINRITVGYPPAATHWLVDDDVFDLYKMGVVYAAPMEHNGQPIKEILHKKVYDNVTENGRLIVLPLGIHFQNSALFNAAIYQELNLPLPTTWRQVLDQAPAITEAGYVPVALSNEAWQFHLVFNTILLEVMGYADFQQIYQKKQSIKGWRRELTESFELFLQLKAIADEGQKTRSWDMAARLVGNKKAALNVMGDFAKAELTQQGLKAGDDFLCSLSPGSGNTIIYAIDAFLMLNVTEPYLKRGQDLLFEVVLDPDVQAAYNAKKGSIPVRHGVDLSQLDACAQASYQQWMRPGTQVARFSGILNPLRTAFFQTALTKAWRETGISAKQLVDELIESDEASMQPGVIK